MARVAVVVVGVATRVAVVVGAATRVAVVVGAATRVAVVVAALVVPIMVVVGVVATTLVGVTVWLVRPAACAPSNAGGKLCCLPAVTLITGMDRNRLINIATLFVSFNVFCRMAISLAAMRKMT